MRESRNGPRNHLGILICEMFVSSNASSMSNCSSQMQCKLVRDEDLFLHLILQLLLDWCLLDTPNNTILESHLLYTVNKRVEAPHALYDW